MATVTFIPYKRQSTGSSKAVCDYVSQDTKTQMEDGTQLLSGQNCCPQLAAQEFLATREMYRKDSPVHFYHYIQSFHPDEPVSPTQAHEIAKEFAAKAWPESEVLIATHIDAPHIHSHFIVNAVCQDSGKMLRQGPRTLAKLRPISDEICMEHGLSVLENDRQKESQGMGTREYRSAARGESWKFRLMNAIDDCMKYASTREDFVSLMQSEDYEIKWTDTRKNITYTTPDGNKCCDDKLHDNKYLKENMIYEFNIRKTALSGRAEAEKCSGFEYGEGCGLSGHGDREELGRSNKPSQPDLGTTGGIDGGSKGTADRQGHGEISGDRESELPEADGRAYDDSIPILKTGWESQRELFLSLGQAGEEDKQRTYRNPAGHEFGTDGHIRELEIRAASRAAGYQGNSNTAQAVPKAMDTAHSSRPCVRHGYPLAAFALALLMPQGEGSQAHISCSRHFHVDRKQWQKMLELKIAHGHRIDDHDDYERLDMRM